ncbi:efflux RND transporter permease subunit [Persicirhabdus sediminis]|uniref:Efflux RND transporter permease subunit n=1 Tax=Persicirhabdus sediminis TaxID=454144 RepID=A0A8J7MIU5_9BACT|nr:efflux RND transporter permease subunit [Persicirhabdus sediminis]MBK1791773.1 efflux RND transporter permease subunit [Persicirhabdus sediminis]
MKNNDPELKGFTAWFAQNSVVANILMLAILAWGGFTLATVRKEVFPSFVAETVTVEVPFQGGTPEDVEKGVSIKIEESLESVQGIDHISSKSTESGSTVTIDALENYPLKTLLDDVKIQVDAISSFPEQAEKPIIAERKRDHSVMWVEIHGPAGEAELKEIARNLRDQLLMQDGISRVDTSGTRDYEISIEPSEDKLRAYNLTFDEVADAVSQNSFDLGAGVIRSKRGEISLRTRSQAYNTNDFATIPLRTNNDGTRIYLRDVADIRDGFVDQEALSRFNGDPTASLQIITEGNDDIIVASDQAKALLEEYRKTASLPEGVQITAWSDESRTIKGRLSLLANNGILGILLVLVVLMLFLNFRLAFWVALGIPISLAGALALFPLDMFDLSLNQLTSFAFIIVLGIVVDDAIVIGESVYSEKEKQKDCNKGLAPLRGTVRGVNKVIVPAIFGVLTTIAAFLPLTTVSGRMGNVFGTIATAVIFCLIFSVVESKLILPAHLAHIDVHKKPTNFISKLWVRFQKKIAGGLAWVIRKIYQPTLRFLMKGRYMVTAAFIAVFILVASLLPSGQLRFVFFPDILRDNMSANLELEEGLPVSYLHEQSEAIGKAILEVGEDFEKSTGHNPVTGVQISASSDTKSSVAVELSPSEMRTTGTDEIVNAWRSKVKGIAGAKGLTFSGKAGPPGDSLVIQLRSDDLDALQVAANDLKEVIKTYPGVEDVQDTFSAGKPEITIDVTPEGEAAGFAQRDLTTNIRDGFFGREAQRIQRGRDEVKVMVRYPIEDRENIETMRDMRVRSADGRAMPFGLIASTEYGEGLAEIERYDNQRIVSVKGEIDKAVTSDEVILKRLQDEYFDEFLSTHPLVSINLSGEAEQREKSMRSLQIGFIVSLVLIYILLAIPLKAYVKPLAIMSVIPFGIIGALLGHYIVGIPVSILSMFGILALSGVVVNDSLVFIHRIDDLAGDYDKEEDSIVQAGGERFRAIMLTSITTFVGLAPLLLETAVQAQFLKPMAVSLGFGVLFATLITLYLLPMLLLIGRDIRVLYQNSWLDIKSLMQKKSS